MSKNNCFHMVSINLSIYPSVCPSVHPFIHPSILRLFSPSFLFFQSMSVNGLHCKSHDFYLILLTSVVINTLKVISSALF